MIIWAVLVLSILVISFILALYSMSDFVEKPAKLKIAYSLYLIRRPEDFTQELLDELCQHLLPSKLLLSVERLFKGGKNALAIYGPKTILEKYSQRLGLLELEDYSLTIGNAQALSWELGFRDTKVAADEKIQLNLKGQDFLWWQEVIQPAHRWFLSGLNGSQNTQKKAIFCTAIRVILTVADLKTRQESENLLLKEFKRLGFYLVPTIYSHNQRVRFYQERALPIALGLATKLSSTQVLKMLQLLK